MRPERAELEQGIKDSALEENLSSIMSPVIERQERMLYLERHLYDPAYTSSY
jgi:hypothetical protein